MLANVEKRYYKIGEVCSHAGIKPHLLRYWEKEIKGIRPFRSLKNQRLYTAESLRLVVRVKQLIDEGYKLESISRRLDDQTAPESGGFIETLKNDLHDIRKLLE